MPMPTFRPPHHHVFKLSGIPSCCFFVLLLQNLLTSAQNAPNPSIASLIGGEANSSSSSGTPIAPGWLEEPIPLLLCAAPGTQQAGQVWVLAVEREAATTCSFQVVFSYPVQLSQVVLDVSAGSWEVEVLTGEATDTQVLLKSCMRALSRRLTVSTLCCHAKPDGLDSKQHSAAWGLAL